MNALHRDTHLAVNTLRLGRYEGELAFYKGHVPHVKILHDMVVAEMAWREKKLDSDFSSIFCGVTNRSEFLEWYAKYPRQTAEAVEIYLEHTTCITLTPMDWNNSVILDVGTFDKEILKTASASGPGPLDLTHARLAKGLKYLVNTWYEENFYYGVGRFPLGGITFGVLNVAVLPGFLFVPTTIEEQRKNAHEIVALINKMNGQMLKLRKLPIARRFKILREMLGLKPGLLLPPSSVLAEQFEMQLEARPKRIPTIEELV